MRIKSVFLPLTVKEIIFLKIENNRNSKIFNIYKTFTELHESNIEYTS